METKVYTKPNYSLRTPQRADSIELMNPPYASMSIRVWREALNTYIRNNPGKLVIPFVVLNIYRKLV